MYATLYFLYSMLLSPLVFSRVFIASGSFAVEEIGKLVSKAAGGGALLVSRGFSYGGCHLASPGGSQGQRGQQCWRRDVVPLGLTLSG